MLTGYIHDNAFVSTVTFIDKLLNSTKSLLTFTPNVRDLNITVDPKMVHISSVIMFSLTKTSV